MTRMKKT